MRIGIFGGSFNPIHNGHIALGVTMLSAMSLDEVWYLVTPQNPWKDGTDDLIDETIRLHLTHLALKDFPRLKASDYEFHLPRPSFSWNTLRHLCEDYPDDEFIIIIGGDNFSRFDRWAHYEEILKNYAIAVFPREGAALPRLTLPATVRIVEVPKINITSTMLRSMMHEGKDISQYVPPKVAEEAPKYYNRE